MVHEGVGYSFPIPTGTRIMGRLILILTLSALSALVYVNFIKPGDTPPEPPPVAKETPITSLSRFVDLHIGKIFSQLDGNASQGESHELRQLRASIGDQQARARAAEQPMYLTAIALCDTLMEAVREREKVNLSLMDTRSKPYSSGTAGDPTKAEEEKRAFFEGGIQRRWIERAATYQKRVDVLYAQLRAHERRLAPAPAAGNPQ
jgi:hypothetical protein